MSPDAISDLGTQTERIAKIRSLEAGSLPSLVDRLGEIIYAEVEMSDVRANEDGAPTSPQAPARSAGLIGRVGPAP